MLEAPLPACESQRLAALHAYQVLDSAPEQAFDDLTLLAAQICGTPIALVSLVDTARQWFKSSHGLGASETPRRVAFCSHSILAPDDVFIVQDARRDLRFSDNPIVTGDPHVIFYAGAPLVTPGGMPIGTVCAIDHEPRRLRPEQVESLRILARQVVTQLELRRACLELQATTGRLAQANQELQEFSSIAAHDLQEPLRKVVAFGGLLRKDLGDELPHRAEQDVGFMTDAALRMQRLISDLLALSRAGSQEMHCESFELRECVDVALEALSLRIEETGAQVSVDTLPTLSGDRTLLSQLFQNLLGNALKFVDQRQPRLHVSCVREGGRTILGVQDNGIGIPPEQVERIFTPFRRLHGLSEYEGSGIGLSVARKAVTRHGGSIWVESEPGQGSHFRFTLPGALPGAPDPTVQADSEPAASGRDH
jgi:signal transduction histidine kinase